MANRTKGEFTLDVGGERYTLVVDINACCAVESLLGVTYVQASMQIARGSITALRGLLWAALQRHHKGTTLEDAGEILQAIGVDTFTATLETVAAESTPDAGDLQVIGIQPKKEPDAAGPQKADATTRVRGIGKRSTEPPAVSA